MKKIIFLLLLILANCVSIPKDQYSYADGEQYVCEEEKAEDCKYQFENY